MNLGARIRCSGGLIAFVLINFRSIRDDASEQESQTRIDLLPATGWPAALGLLEWPTLIRLLAAHQQGSAFPPLNASRSAATPERPDSHDRWEADGFAMRLIPTCSFSIARKPPSV
jgi:hypothetical protein